MRNKKKERMQTTQFANYVYGQHTHTHARTHTRTCTLAFAVTTTTFAVTTTTFAVTTTTFALLLLLPPLFQRLVSRKTRNQTNKVRTKLRLVNM